MVNKKLTYTVLPAIKNCTKAPVPSSSTYKSNKKPKPQQEIASIESIEQSVLLPEPEHTMPNILDMSVGQLGNYITTLRDENIKLKQTIETIVHLAIQAGVVEQE